MRINRVKEVTNLTSKAISYYEKMGLVKPNIENNGYRDYTPDHIERLNMISCLRNLDMSVKEIKNYIDCIDKRKKLLENHLKDIRTRKNELAQIECVVGEMIIASSLDYREINNRVDIINHVNEDYILKSLCRLFPDGFSRYFVIHFSTYLKEPLDTEEKMKAYCEMIEFLDHMEISLSERALNYINILQDEDDEKVNEIYTNMNNRTKELSNIDLDNISEINALKDYINTQNKEMQNMNHDVYLNIKDILSEIKTQLNECGYYSIFIEKLKIISPKYRAYLDKMMSLSEKVGLE